MTVKKTTTYSTIRTGQIKKSEPEIKKRIFTWGDIQKEETMNDMPGQEVMRFVAKSASSRIIVDQHDGRMEETVELFVTGNRIVGNSPDGSRVIMSIKGHNGSLHKSDSAGLVLGFVPDKVEGMWKPEIWASTDLVREIRDIFRHWQNTKIGDILVFISLSRSPHETAGIDQNVVRGFQISIPEVAD
jgi:hypothetical protein